MTKTFYHLALGGSPGWQYAVDYAPHHAHAPFYFSVGCPRESHGAYLSASEALEPQWRGEMEKAGALWLVPLFERLVGGEGVSVEDVLDAFLAVHGHAPSSDELPVRWG